MDNLKAIQKAQKGDASAFGEIYDLFAGRIFRFVYIKVRNRQQAEDILQETFVKAWQALPRFNLQAGNLSAWLYRIAANTMNDHFRKTQRQPQTLELNEEIYVTTGINSAEDITKQTDIETVKKIFAFLPPAYRTVLELRFVQDFSIKETAGILGKSQLAVRLAQHRALKKLKELISKQYAIQYPKI